MLDEEEEKDIFLAVIEPRRCRYKGHMETREREDQLSKTDISEETLLPGATFSNSCHFEFWGWFASADVLQ